MADIDIFDFETILPAACKQALLDAGDLTVLGQSLPMNVWIISDPPEFQKLRPRVEIVYRSSGESNPRRIVFLPDGTKRGSAFNGELKIHAITDADVPGKAFHAAYRAAVRERLARLQDSVNGVTLLLHKIQWLEPGNEQTGIRTADGYQQTTFPFQVMLSIQADAWAQLA